MNITEQAQLELKKGLDSFNKPEAGIHIFSTQGCCGPSILMNISGRIGNDETAVNIEGIEFFIANDLLQSLDNANVEYGENGFRLHGFKKSSNSGCCG